MNTGAGLVSVKAAMNCKMASAESVDALLSSEQPQVKTTAQAQKDFGLDFPNFSEMLTHLKTAQPN